MEQRLSFITLGVKDLAASEAFYSGLLGWTRTPDSDVNSIVFYKLNGIRLSLFPRENLAEDAHVAGGGSGFAGFTLAHNLRSEAEVDALFAKLKEKGVRVVKEPQKVFWGGYSGYFSDPDGFLWEVVFSPFNALDAEGNLL
jgi:catechol 2,3-dioxygenase-like lactoylglutathione lyase family enzyme